MNKNKKKDKLHIKLKEFMTMYLLDNFQISFFEKKFERIENY